MIKVDEINYSTFGKCVHISNGSIKLVVTLNFGPRIIRAAYVGKENFMFEDVDGKYVTDVGGKMFHNYGGHMLIPVNNNDTGYLPNRYVVLWPYTKMNDPRVNWGDKFIVMDQTEA